MLALIALAAGAGSGHRVRGHGAAIRAFQDSHSAALVTGKNAAQIFATFGKPFAVQRAGDGTPELILYKDVPLGQYCAIELRNGVAVAVSFSFQ